MNYKKTAFLLLCAFQLYFSAVNAQNCWAYEEYIPPVRGGGSVIITEVYFDTRYSERIETNYHHLGEFVELFNSSTIDIDLTGWRISDHHTQFYFPAGTIIPSGEVFIVAYGGRIEPNINPFGYNAYGKGKFIELFPEAAGQESNIIMQNNFILWNARASIELYNQNSFLIDKASYINSQTTTTDCQENFCGYIYNGDGGVFNGPISEHFKDAIYLENPAHYYDHENYNEPYVISTATPLSIPYEIALQAPSEVLNAFPEPPFPDIENFDSNANYIYSEIFDPLGEMVSKSGSYYDGIGRPKLNYTWDKETNRVWGTQTIYDRHGRPAIHTLGAPSCSGFSINPFIFENYNSYVQNDADYTLLNTIVNQSHSSLRRYYSNDNSNELYQATTDRPYVRTVYDRLNPGNVVATIGGNKIDNEWKTGFSYTMPAAQEMYYAFGQNYFEGPLTGLGKEVVLKSFKSVSIDPHGNEVVMFSDAEGKILATARSGGAINYEVVSTIGWQKFVDVHIPKGITNNQIEFIGGTSGYTVWNLRTGQTVNTSQVAGGNVYRIEHNTNSNNKTYITTNGIINSESGAKGIRYPVNYYDFALNYYDKTGKLTKSTQPLGFNTAAFNLAVGTLTHGMATTYHYNVLGQLINTSRPDEGFASFVYRNDGQIRFSRNTEQLTNGEFSYTNYDNRGRPIESGVSTSVNPYFLSISTISPNFSTDVGLTSQSGFINKIEQTSWEESGFSSIENTGAHNFEVTFQFSQDMEGIVGLSESYTDNHYESVEYGLYFINNQVSIYESGRIVDRNISEYDESDVFSLKRIEETLFFLKNNEVISEMVPWGKAEQSYPSLIIHGALYTEGATVSNIIIKQLDAFASTPVVPPNDFVVDPETCKEQVFTIYDIPDTQGLHYVLYPSIPGGGFDTEARIQRFVAGNVSKTLTRNPETTTTWYSYDIYGRVEWVVQFINGLGAKTIDYEYDAKGQVHKVYYQKDDVSERFVHKYTYNNGGKLKKVETSYDNIHFTEHATYDYYKSGELKRTLLAEGLQGIDYVYTLGGSLKAINHPGLTDSYDPGNDQNDAFGMIIDYHKNDYMRDGVAINASPSGNDRFDGNIKAVRWGTTGLSNPGIQSGYSYQYNDNKWLTAATFGTFNTNGIFSQSPVDDFMVNNITYDANGNILTLYRNKESTTGSNIMDRLSYNYNSGKNQLNHVNDSYPNMDDDGDIKDQDPNNYLYNSIGQLIENIQDQVSYNYFATGLTKSVNSTNLAGTGVSFYYNDRGQRVEKRSYANGNVNQKTFYIRDVSGTPLAIYTLPDGHYDSRTVFKEYPIYGMSRIGVADQHNTFKYELTDYLGNVRAVIQRDGHVFPVFYDDFSSGLVSTSWNSTTTSELSVVNERLKVKVTGSPNSVSVGFPVTAGHTYNIQFDTDLDETVNFLDYYVDGSLSTISNNVGTAIENGSYSFNYTASATTNIQLVFRLQSNSMLEGPTNNYFLDDVKITDVTTTNTPIMLAHKDYYPFGMPMPNRNIEGQYRYGYQGQFAETDPETGMPAFELRLWDARIGRWLTPDPYGQYYSTYLGMGNDPINGIDPDGGFKTYVGAWLYRLVNGLKGVEIIESENPNVKEQKFNLGYKYFDEESGTEGMVMIVGANWEKNKLPKIQKLNPSITFNNKTEYVYTKSDLFRRNIISQPTNGFLGVETNNVLYVALQQKEIQGFFEPLGLHDWIDHHGENYYNNYRFFMGVRLGLPLSSVGAGLPRHLGTKSTLSPRFKGGLQSKQEPLKMDFYEWMRYMYGSN